MVAVRDQSAGSDAPTFEVSSERTGPHVFLGILLIIVGLIALGSLTLTSVITTIFFGWLFLIGGVAQLFSVFFVQDNRLARGLVGLLFGVLGLAIIASPGLSLATFTLLLAIAWTISGIIRMIGAFFDDRTDGTRGWSVAGGFVTFLLGVLIFAGWPASSLYIIALFVGIDFVLAGLILATTGLWRWSPSVTS